MIFLKVVLATSCLDEIQEEIGNMIPSGLIAAGEQSQDMNNLSSVAAKAAKH